MKKNALDISNYIFIASLFFILSLFSGCSVYYPQTIPISLPAEKGDGEVGMMGSVYFSGAGSFSYAPTKHLVIQPHIYGANGLSHFQLTASYFHFGENDHSVFETGIGGSTGIVNIEYDKQRLSAHYIYKGNYNTVFNQTVIGLKNPHFEVGVYNRFGFMFPNFDYTADINRDNETSHQIVKYRQERFLLEDGIFIKTGGKHIKFFSAIGTAFLWKKNESIYYSGFDYFSFNMSTGLIVSFNLKKQITETQNNPL